MKKTGQQALVSDFQALLWIFSTASLTTMPIGQARDCINLRRHRQNSLFSFVSITWMCGSQMAMAAPSRCRTRHTTDPAAPHRSSIYLVSSQIRQPNPMLVAWKMRNDVDAIDLARQDTIHDVGCLIDLSLAQLWGNENSQANPTIGLHAMGGAILQDHYIGSGWMWFKDCWPKYLWTSEIHPSFFLS